MVSDCHELKEVGSYIIIILQDSILSVAAACHLVSKRSGSYVFHNW